jgi:hypothetical protein
MADEHQSSTEGVSIHLSFLTHSVSLFDLASHLPLRI